MNVIAVPVGNMNTASSRIRCFRFMSFMPKEVKYRIETSVNCGGTRQEILYLQKVAQPSVVQFVKEYRRRGGKVVYDLDDDFGIWPGMDEVGMCNAVDAVTTDTVFRADKIRGITSTPVHVIPDVIDYVDSNSRGNPLVIRDEINSVVTFGSNHSVSIVAPVFDLITGYRKEYIGQRPGVIRNCNFCLWQANMFLENLKKHDVAFLIHDSNDLGNSKSNNRLLVCMSIGIPTIASNTVAYAQTLKNVDAEFLILKDVQDVNDILKHLGDKDIRQNLSKKFVKYAWDNYSPESSSLKLYELFRSL